MTTNDRWQSLKEAFGHRVEEPLRDHLTDLGERHGIDWLIYNPLRMLAFHRYARRDAPAVIAAIEDVLPGARSYADVGAGSGGFAAEASRRGHDVLAYERSRVGRWLAHRQGVPTRAFDLRRELTTMVAGRADVAYCLEVAEHLPPELGERLITFLTLVAPQVVFSAAHPGQGGAGHVNEQPREYWTERFLRRGFGERQDLGEQLRAAVVKRGVGGAWFPVNLAVYARRD